MNEIQPKAPVRDRRVQESKNPKVPKDVVDPSSKAFAHVMAQVKADPGVPAPPMRAKRPPPPTPHTRVPPLPSGATSSPIAQKRIHSQEEKPAGDREVDGHREKLLDKASSNPERARALRGTPHRATPGDGPKAEGNLPVSPLQERVQSPLPTDQAATPPHFTTIDPRYLPQMIASAQHGIAGDGKRVFRVRTLPGGALDIELTVRIEAPSEVSLHLSGLDADETVRSGELDRLMAEFAAGGVAVRSWHVTSYPEWRP